MVFVCMLEKYGPILLCWWSLEISQRQYSESENGYIYVVLLKLQENQLATNRIVMNVFTNDNKLISINKWIAVSHHHVKPSLTALRALSGYNSVSMMFGISKSKI